MGRQLRLGDLKRRQAEEAVASASGAHRRRQEAAFVKARAAAMRLARAEERRQGVAVLRVDMAKQLAARPENKGKTVVCIIPSFGERYLSTALYANLWEEASSQKAEPLE